jgi:hypothetical protein
MRRIVFSVIVAFTFLLTARRLPAPILEESPIPTIQKPRKPNPPPQSKVAAQSNPTPFSIPQSQMTASASSAQPGGGEPRNAIDGNPTTGWHTPWGLLGSTISLPQSITLNLGGTYNVNTLRYLPRQDSGLGSLNGIISTYRIYVSTDGNNFVLVASGKWPEDHSEKSVTFAARKASYIRLEAVVGHNGHASAAELNVIATR